MIIGATQPLTPGVSTKFGELLIAINGFGRIGRCVYRVARERPDVLHVHQWIRLTSNLLEIADELGIPAVVTLHDLYDWRAQQTSFTGLGHYTTGTVNVNSSSSITTDSVGTSLNTRGVCVVITNWQPGKVRRRSGTIRRCHAGWR